MDDLEKEVNDLEGSRSINYSKNIKGSAKKGKDSKKVSMTVVAGMRLAPGMKVSTDGYIYMEESFVEKES